MRGKGVVLGKLLVLVVAIAVAAGCSAQKRRLEGANQDLVGQRNALNAKILDLQQQIAGHGADMADMEVQLRKAKADAEYWKGKSDAYGSAVDQYKDLQAGLPDKLMKDLAERLGGIYLVGGGIRLSSDVLFDSGKADLKASAKEALGTVAQAFQSQEARELHLRIDGHTDKDPITRSRWADNMQLSQARARAVWVELAGRGVAADRMFTAGFGEYKPIADNGSSQGKSLNRRVEIWIVPAPGAAPTATASAEDADMPEPVDAEDAPLPMEEVE